MECMAWTTGALDCWSRGRGGVGEAGGEQGQEQEQEGGRSRSRSRRGEAGCEQRQEQEQEGGHAGMYWLPRPPPHSLYGHVQPSNLLKH